MAQLVLEDAGPSVLDRVTLAFRLVLARDPTADESRVLVSSVARLLHEFSDDRAAARKYLAVGESKRDERLDVVEHASYAALCSMILNLDEALMKE
jgi:hypothetical protein